MVKTAEQIGVLILSAGFGWSLSLAEVESFMRIGGAFIPICTSGYILYKTIRKDVRNRDKKEH